MNIVALAKITTNRRTYTLGLVEKLEDKTTNSKPYVVSTFETMQGSTHYSSPLENTQYYSETSAWDYITEQCKRDNYSKK